MKHAPFAADQAAEIEPGRAAQMARIGQELRAVESLGEDFFAELDRGLLIELAKPVGVVGFFRGLNDEGRGLRIKLVDVRLEPAVLGLLKIKCKGVERLLGAEPDEAVGPDHHVGLELLGIASADPGIDAVTGDDQVGVGVFEIGFDLALEDELDTQRFTAPLKNIEQMLAPDTDEAMARRALARPLEDELDVVPVIEGVLDLGRALGVGKAHRGHHGIREHDAPAERIVGLVALDDRDDMLRVPALHQQAQIETGRAAADTDYAHDPSLSRVAPCAELSPKLF
ncbi:hypothetical protein ACVWZR_010126 [Bradyrhizobium sp. i1.3.1]